MFSGNQYLLYINYYFDKLENYFREPTEIRYNEYFIHFSNIYSNVLWKIKSVHYYFLVKPEKCTFEESLDIIKIGFIIFHSFY
jgi:hypothetical protein